MEKSSSQIKSNSPPKRTYLRVLNKSIPLIGSIKELNSCLATSEVGIQGHVVFL